MTDLTIASAGELFEVRARGLIAAMLKRRCMEPTRSQWAFIRGERSITIRDLAEVAHDTGFELEVSTANYEPLLPADETQSALKQEGE